MDTDETQVTLIGLPVEERRLLAGFAVVGRASLSEAQLATLVELDDVRPLVDDLVRRGLIEASEAKRYSLVGRLAADVRRSEDAVESGQRLLGYLTVLARADELTPARAAEELDAILGLSEWLAESGRFEEVLVFVKTVEAAVALARHVQQLVELLERALHAARTLHDRDAEIWVLERLSSASSELEDRAAARAYREEAERLQRLAAPAAAARAGWAALGFPRTLLSALALVLVGGAGLGAGYAAFHRSDSAATNLVTVPQTVVRRLTVRGRAGTVTATTRLPGRTVTTRLSGSTVTTTATTTLPGSTATETVATTLTEPTTILSTTTVVSTVFTTPLPSSGG